MTSHKEYRANTAPRDIPDEIKRVQLEVRIVDGIPMLFTTDGRYVELVTGQWALSLSVNAPVGGTLSCTIDVLLPSIQFGWPIEEDEPDDL